MSGWTWQAWIFDLDDTLLDTSGVLIPIVSYKVCDFFVSNNFFANKDEAHLYWNENKIKYSGKELIQNLVNEKIDDLELREKVIHEAYKIFRTPELPNSLPILPGGKEILHLASNTLPLFLVTQGDIHTQIKKVELMNLKNLFTQIHYIEPYLGENKSIAFKALINQYKLNPNQILSIGNRLDNEIELSKELGMATCYFPYGEHQNEAPKNKNQRPDFIIRNLSELQALLNFKSQKFGG